MTIELFFSNRLETLADKFAETVDLENQVKENIFEGPFTIVPNQNLSKWLQLHLAGKQSVFMNVNFQYLEAGLWDLFSRLDPGEEPPDMMQSSHIRMFLLWELMALTGDEEAMRPLSRYLLDPEGGRMPGYAVKLWQLTERMVGLFEAYPFHRTAMIEKWLDSRYQAEGMERCQQILYLKMRDIRDRYAAKTGKRLLSLVEYAKEVLGNRATAPHGTEPAEPRRWVHLFGLSQVSPFHLSMIGRLRNDFSIFIYSLNPCREFWEDIQTPQEKRWIQRRAATRFAIRPEEKEQGELLDEEPEELLAMWGKPGREHIRLLCHLTDYDFNACFERESSGATVLRAVQNRILTLTAEADDGERRPQDTSLQITACPGIYREMETVYNSILYNLENHPKLQLTDIAIFVPDMSAYKPAIDSVFNRRPRRLPYNLVDSRADIESIYGQAVRTILELTAGRFSRREVFELLLNPCFMHRWGIRFEDVAVWVQWAESLNIFHSYDRSAKETSGYAANDFYTWKQGLQRLRLSRIMAIPEEGLPDGGISARFDAYQGRVPFQDVHTGDEGLMETFSVVIERLYRSLTDLAGLHASGEAWSAHFLKVCEELLAVPPGLRGESAVQASLRESFDELKIYDQLQGAGPETEDNSPGLDIAFIREFVTSRLGAISGGFGDYLTGGVTISALMPMRPIPFSIAYVLGMEEGAFPGKADISSLDLRLQKRQIGDVSLPERNRYLFLEMLLSVRDKLYISYVSRDLQKDREIQACSVVNQLRRYVEETVLPPGDRFAVTEVPLKGSSQKYRNADAVNHGSDVLVNYSMADRIAFYQENGPWEKAAAELDDAELKHLRTYFPEFSVSRGRTEKDERWTENISIRELRMFLESPVLQGLRRHLGVHEEKSSMGEATLREDEPFCSEFPLDYELKIGPLKMWLDRVSASVDAAKRPQIAVDAHEQLYASMSRKSQTPEGAFGELDKRSLRDDVALRAATLEPVLEQMTSSSRSYRALFLGEQTGEYISPGNRLPVAHFDPLRLRIQAVNDRGVSTETEVEIHGQLPWVWNVAQGEWHALVLTGSGKKPGRVPDKYILEPLLFWLCWLSSPSGREWAGDAAVTFHVVYRESVKTWRYCVASDAAEAYLNRLIGDYLNQERTEWLPFAAVTSQSVRPHRMTDEPVVDDAIRETYYAQLREAYLDETSPLVRLAQPVIPEDAFERVRERFGIFFDTSEGKRTSNPA